MFKFLNIDDYPPEKNIQADTVQQTYCFKDLDIIPIRYFWWEMPLTHFACSSPISSNFPMYSLFSAYKKIKWL